LFDTAAGTKVFKVEGPRNGTVSNNGGRPITP
jgi:hypothetical protein